MVVQKGRSDGSGEAYIAWYVESLTEPRTQLAAMFSILLLVAKPACHPHIIADLRRDIGQWRHLHSLLPVVQHLSRLSRLGFAESVRDDGRLLNLRGDLTGRTLLTGQLP